MINPQARLYRTVFVNPNLIPGSKIVEVLHPDVEVVPANERSPQQSRCFGLCLTGCDHDAINIDRSFVQLARETLATVRWEREDLHHFPSSPARLLPQVQPRNRSKRVLVRLDDAVSPALLAAVHVVHSRARYVANLTLSVQLPEQIPVHLLPVVLGDSVLEDSHHLFTGQLASSSLVLRPRKHPHSSH